MTKMSLVADVDRCTGCGICELICSMDKHGEYNPERSYIRVLANKETYTFVPLLDMRCDFCGRCVKGCPAEALSLVKSEEALLMTQEAKRGRLPVPRFCGNKALV